MATDEIAIDTPPAATPPLREKAPAASAPAEKLKKRGWGLFRKGGK